MALKRLILIRQIEDLKLIFEVVCPRGNEISIFEGFQDSLISMIKDYEVHFLLINDLRTSRL